MSKPIENGWSSKKTCDSFLNSKNLGSTILKDNHRTSARKSNLTCSLSILLHNNFKSLYFLATPLIYLTILTALSKTSFNGWGRGFEDRIRLWIAYWHQEAEHLRVWCNHSKIFDNQTLIRHPNNFPSRYWSWLK